MIQTIISSRRAVFPAQYNSQPILSSELEQILKAANWAPTHRRTEPWRFKVFYTQEARSALSEFLGNTYHATSEKYSEVKHKKIVEKPLQSQCVIAICMQRDPKASVPEWEEIAATAMAVQNMWLVAHAMEIGAYWSTPALKDYLGNHIPLVEGERCLGFFYMGKYDPPTEGGHRNSEIDEKTTWI